MVTFTPAKLVLDRLSLSLSGKPLLGLQLSAKVLADLRTRVVGLESASCSVGLRLPPTVRGVTKSVQAGNVLILGTVSFYLSPGACEPLVD